MTNNRTVNRAEVSVVVPLLNEVDSLGELVGRIGDALSPKWTYEIILVDDGSDDGSWEKIAELTGQSDRVRGIRFRRNYGKSAALQQGFLLASGKYVATMDADLQDDPAEIPEMIRMIEEQNLDLVSGWKKKRYDPISKTIPSCFFNYVTSLTTGIKLHDFNCGLKVYRAEVVGHLTLYGELHRYIPYLAKQEGFERIGEKVVQHHPRKFGESKFGLSRFIKGFLDLVTLLFLGHYMKRPMHFFGGVGTLFLIIGGAITLYLTVMRLFFEVYLSGRPLFLFGILFLLLGVQFFSVGFLGEILNQNRAGNKGDPVNIQDIAGFDETNEIDRSVPPAGNSDTEGTGRP
ncbi:glycosyltransferase family 2 protein [Balneolales bacterium ANBcel1]|nr:glycosyltransferase family 2 protein [Balneolales bacterium ANBcel1]